MKVFRCACVASVALRLPAAYHFGTGSGKGRKGQVWEGLEGGGGVVEGMSLGGEHWSSD